MSKIGASGGSGVAGGKSLIDSKGDDSNQTSNVTPPRKRPISPNHGMETLLVVVHGGWRAFGIGRLGAELRRELWS